MCHKFHYIILYGNNISKLLSMHIIHDCETKFNLKVKKIKHSIFGLFDAVGAHSH